MMRYRVAERFKSLQGEGVYTGTPMAFIRFVGCSVGKTICQHCDTDFDKMGPQWRGGGEYTARELGDWAAPHKHICLTGGEPLDQDLTDLLNDPYFLNVATKIHIETSGTKPLENLFDLDIAREQLWICVSPKPGFLEDVIEEADEVKVIVPGLGEINPKVASHWHIAPFAESDGELKRWPDLDDAIRWEKNGKPVFLQPRNGKFDIDYVNMMYVADTLKAHPQLRLSVQMHKILKVQ